MDRAALFTEAHRLTRESDRGGLSYRDAFGCWLRHLQSGVATYEQVLARLTELVGDSKSHIEAATTLRRMGASMDHIGEASHRLHSGGKRGAIKPHQTHRVAAWERGRQRSQGL